MTAVEHDLEGLRVESAGLQVAQDEALLRCSPPARLGESLAVAADDELQLDQGADAQALQLGGHRVESHAAVGGLESAPVHRQGAGLAAGGNSTRSITYRVQSEPA